MWFYLGTALTLLVAAFSALRRTLPWIDKHTSADLQEIPGFLSEDECDRWVAWIKNHPECFATSAVDDGWVFHRNTIKTKQRTSRQCWLDPYFHPLAMNFSLTAARHLHVYLNGASYAEERVQVVAYSIGGYFRPHYDERPSLFGSLRGRMATVLVYLNDDYEGGETLFPNAKIHSIVRPKKGKAILFRNLHPTTGRCLYESYHEGTPVLRGRKYILNLWIHYAT